MKNMERQIQNRWVPATVLLAAAGPFAEWRDFATPEFIYLRVISGADKEETSQPLIKRDTDCVLVVSAMPFRPDLTGGAVTEENILFIWFL